jgi:hypothetical protein
LEQKNGKWRVTVAVPRHLRSALGTRLKRSLRTDSLALANQLKWPIIAELKRTIDEASRGKRGDPLLTEAVELAAMRSMAEDNGDVDNLDDGIRLRADELRGEPVETEADPSGHPRYLYDLKESAALAST